MKQKSDDNGRAERRTQKMMPFGAAAKAIFVKANGLVAYQDATGTGKRVDDEQRAQDDDTGAQSSAAGNKTAKSA